MSNLAMIDRHKIGKPSEYGANLTSIAFAESVSAIVEADADILNPSTLAPSLASSHECC